MSWRPESSRSWKNLNELAQNIGVTGIIFTFTDKYGWLDGSVMRMRQIELNLDWVIEYFSRFFPLISICITEALVCATIKKILFTNVIYPCRKHLIWRVSSRLTPCSPLKVSWDFREYNFMSLFPWNIRWISVDYHRFISQKIELFMTSATRTSNPTTAYTFSLLREVNFCIVVYFGTVDSRRTQLKILFIYIMLCYMSIVW